MDINKIRAGRIAREVKQLNNDTNEHGFSCEQLEDDSLSITFPGPRDSPFQNEIFSMSVGFDKKYPFTAPRVQLLTKIYHPNIDQDGKICINILTMQPEGDYNPTMSLQAIVLSIQMLISTPNPYSPLREDAAADIIYNYPIYETKVQQQIEENRKAREMVSGP